MNRIASKLILTVIAFSAVSACSHREAHAGVRRGLLYDMFHSGSRCDSADGSCEGYSPSQSLEAWIGGQLESEKWRIREDIRFHHLHFYLHRQDKKKLLHRECPPFQDCYWGYYPTSWRVFPREPHCANCPPAGPDTMYYDDAGPLDAPLDDWDPEIDVPAPAAPRSGPEFSDSPPPLPEAALPAGEVPPEPAPAPYVE